MLGVGLSVMLEVDMEKEWMLWLGVWMIGFSNGWLCLHMIERLFEKRKRRQNEAKDSNHDGDKPLPMFNENVTQCTDGPCCPVPSVVAHYKRRFGVNIFALPPIYDDLSKVRTDAQVETSNVEVTGAARLYRAASVWTAGLVADVRNEICDPLLFVLL